MTRLPPEGSKEKPLVREVGGLLEELVASMTDRTVELRPKRSRDPEAVVRFTWASIYQRGLMAKAEERIRSRRRK